VSQRPASFVALLGDRRVIAVVRHDDADAAQEICHSLVEGGMRAVEVTCAVPDTAAVIASVRGSLGDEVIVGAGTVLTREQLDEVVAGGAQFVVSPGLDRAIVERCVAARIPALPGVLTPSEVAHGQSLGLDALKLFPAQSLGPDHLRALRSVFGAIAFVPTGGVTSANAGGWLAAGAHAVGLAGEISEAHRDGGREAVRRLARTLTQAFEAS
jgi:2-dehydro-3-deoxyphosphogluconate aldolase/(4S)-4-hydroxy-2-oxoglutarate aldolase